MRKCDSNRNDVNNECIRMLLVVWNVNDIAECHFASHTSILKTGTSATELLELDPALLRFRVSELVSMRSTPHAAGPLLESKLFSNFLIANRSLRGSLLKPKSVNDFLIN